MGAVCGKEKSSKREKNNKSAPVAQQPAAAASNNQSAAAAARPTTTTAAVSATAQQKESVSVQQKNEPTSHNDKQAQREADYNKMKDEHEKEHQRTEEMYQKQQAEVDKIAKERDDLHKQADKAFEEGNKSLGYELREKAKAKTKELESASKNASRAVFTAKNAKNDKYTVDLHGLHSNDAIELLKERMEEIKGSNKQFTIITGAGNHSDANGPKIKPMVHKLLKEKGIAFEEVNNGSIQCTI